MSSIALLISVGVIIGCMGIVDGQGTGLEAFWPLDEGTGAEVMDNSSNQNDGTVMDATWTAGRFGWGLSFAGGGGVTVPDHPTLEVGVKDFSVGLWFRTHINATQVLASKWDLDVHGYEIRLAQNGTIGFLLCDGVDATEAFYPTRFHDDEWHHVMLVRDFKDSVHLYYDGNIVTNISDGTGAIADTDEDLCFGRPSWSTSVHGFAGSLDEIVLFRRELTSFEVRHLYEESLSLGRPVWLPVPTQHAIEDIPCTLDAKYWFIDLDTPRDKLGISSDSDFVRDIDDFYVTFLFPNGYTRATVELKLWDPPYGVETYIEFVIQAINDPPEHSIPMDHTAVEDVVRSLILTPYVWDIDNDTADLFIVEDDPYATADRLRLDVLFPNGVLEHEMPLVLSDGLNQTGFKLRFVITPVNDPPEHNMAREHDAVEDIPIVFSLVSDIWDVDTSVVELEITSDSEYLVRNTLNITFTFPEGVTEHECEVHVSDGEFIIAIPLLFRIQSVDDPPTIRGQWMERVKEEEVRELDLRALIRDIDTDWEDLTIITDNPNVSVHGDILWLVFPVGGIVVEVNVTVSDGFNPPVTGRMMVYIDAVNDPPRWLEIPSLDVHEDSEYVIDLNPYVSDEETSNELLSLDIDHPNAILVQGLVVMLLFTEGPGSHVIGMNVSDGKLSSQCNLTVSVLPVNDPPRIIRTRPSLGGQSVKIFEGDVFELRILAEDEDDQTIQYETLPEWSGAEIMPNGTLWIHPARGDVGTVNLTVKVSDPAGAHDSINITITVLNVNDAPAFLEITSPRDGALFREGDDITFEAHFSDPDTALGQQLSVEWMSNLDGIIWQENATTGDQFTTASLSPGVHTITVTVFDGEHRIRTSIEITVEQDRIGFGHTSWMLMVVLLAVMIAVLAYLWHRRPG